MFKFLKELPTLMDKKNPIFSHVMSKLANFYFKIFLSVQ